MADLILNTEPVLNPTLLRVLAIWVPEGVQATWATLHWSVVPRENWPNGWEPPEQYRWQRPDYYPDAKNPFELRD